MSNSILHELDLIYNSDLVITLFPLETESIFRSFKFRKLKFSAILVQIICTCRILIFNLQMRLLIFAK